METDESELERSEFEALEPGFEKFEMETEGRAAGTTAAISDGAATAGAFGWSAGATTPGIGTAGVFTGIGDLATASSARVAGTAVVTAASDSFSSKRRPAWVLPFVAVMRTGTEPELAIQLMPSTCATPDASV
jgi:hypothetical protein